MSRYLWLAALGAVLVLLVFFGTRAPQVSQPHQAQVGSSGEGEYGEVITGFSTPESVVVGPGGKYYISNLGRPGRTGDGKIMVLEDGVLKDLALGLDDPKGLAIYGEALYVADIDKVWRVSFNGHKEIFLSPEDFPRRPAFLNDVAIAPSSDRLYISDTQLGLIFTMRTCLCGGVGIFAQRARFPELQAPNGLAFDGAGNLLVIDSSTGKLLKIEPNGSSAEVIGEGFGGGDGLAFDAAGNLYISDYTGGRIFKRGPDGSVTLFAQGLKAPADLTVDLTRKLLLIPEFEADRLRLLPLGID
jgi:sugar lactone lactonase YvrE